MLAGSEAKQSEDFWTTSHRNTWKNICDKPYKSKQNTIVDWNNTCNELSDSSIINVLFAAFTVFDINILTATVRRIKISQKVNIRDESISKLIIQLREFFEIFYREISHSEYLKINYPEKKCIHKKNASDIYENTIKLFNFFLKNFLFCSSLAFYSPFIYSDIAGKKRKNFFRNSIPTDASLIDN